jgi:hypothetical protein
MNQTSPLNQSKIVTLDKFIPRHYQIPFLDELLNKQKIKRYLLVWPRRAGKDLVCFYACIRKMIEKPMQVYFVYPTYSQGKKILWEGLNNEGFPLLNYLPQELIASKNSQEMSIRLINGSLFKIVGAEDPDRLVGTNASFMVFSEYAIQSPLAWQYLRQVVRVNQGTAIFIGTPRGRNHMYQLYEYALTNPEWFVSKLTVDDTQHVSQKDLAKEALETSEDMMQQEWYTSFFLGVEGSYYSKYLNSIRINGQIDKAPWMPYEKVHLAADIGHDDATAIVWFQVKNNCVFIIDAYSNRKQGLDHYAKIILSKPYTYGKMIFPHDLAVTEFGSGLTRKEQAINLGLNPTIAPKLSIEDGIEAVRALIPRCYFDEKKCAPLIKALESYRQEYDSQRQVYKPKPLHDFASDYADAFRYLAVSQNLLSDTYSPDDLNRLYMQGRLGQNEVLPKPFQQPNFY